MQNESQKNCNLSVSRTQANLGATRPEAAEKSPDVGRRYRCKYLRISLKISNFTSNSNTL